MFKPAAFRPLVWLLIAWLPAATVRAESLVFQIGLSTTQVRTFDINNPITYNFGVTQAGGSANLQGVQFAFFVDRGQNTTAPVTFNLYNGLGGVSGTNTTTGANVSLGITTVSATSYPTAGGNNVAASLTAPILLGAGEYSVQLTTTASGAGKTYAWKPGPLQLTSTSGANLNNFLYIEDNNQSGTAGNTLNAASPVLAQPLLSLTSVTFGNFRTGATLSQSVGLTNNNLPTANNYSQALAGTPTTTGGASVSGVPTTASPLGQGFIQSLGLGLASGTVGPTSGSVALDYLSVPGTSLTTGTTAVGSGTISISGTGYNWANAVYSGTAFNFGFVHRGGAALSGTVAIGNQTVTNAFYQDSLNVSASTGNSLVSASGFTGLGASTGGSSRNNLVVSIGTGTAGALNSALALSLVSNANSVAGLSDGTATTVGSPGSITTTGTVYSGQSVWATNGGGQWGTLASSFGTNWENFNGSPGLDAGFTNTDTATFGAVLTGGTATVTIASATPSVKSLTFDNAAASYVLAGASGGSLALLNAGTNAAAISVASGSHTISSAISLGSNTALEAAAGSRLSIDGIVSGSRNLRKTGGGTAVLSGSNTYAGTTTVAEGRLLIHGSQTTATGSITVESGATLGGRGAAGGAVTVLPGGTLSPGASVESLGVGATTFSGSSTFFYEVDSSASLSTAADLLTVNGNLSIENGSLLQFTDLASSPSAFEEGTTFSLISYGTNSWNGGFFTYGTNQLTNGEIFSAGLNDWQIKYDDTTGGSNFPADQASGKYVTITTIAVPEPASLALLAAAALTLGFWGFGSRRRGERPRSAR